MTLRCLGSLRPTRAAHCSAPVSGRVTRVHVKAAHSAPVPSLWVAENHSPAPHTLGAMHCLSFPSWPWLVPAASGSRGWLRAPRAWTRGKATERPRSLGPWGAPCGPRTTQTLKALARGLKRRACSRPLRAVWSQDGGRGLWSAAGPAPVQVASGVCCVAAGAHASSLTPERSQKSLEKPSVALPCDPVTPALWRRSQEDPGARWPIREPQVQVGESPDS